MTKIKTNSTLYSLFPLIISLLLSLPFEANCQLKKSKKTKEKEEHALSQKLWYGGGINLGYSSNVFNQFQTNIFGFGISPMVGYKLNPVISVGPRISLDWTIAKFSDFGGTYKYNSLDYGIGVFARAKFLQTFFAHVEYSVLNETFTDGTINANNELNKFRRSRDIFLIGLGYNSGQNWGYEIYVNYDFLTPSNSYLLPIVYRAGITYKF